MSGIVGHRGLLMGSSPPPSGDDPYWSNVVLLLDGSSYADGSTPSGIDVTGKTATWTADAQIDTSQYKFGSSSIYLDGTNDRISFADSDDWYMGAGDFTVEAWVRQDSGASSESRSWIGQANPWNGDYPFNCRVMSTRKCFIGIRNAAHDAWYSDNLGVAIAEETWIHFAMTRYSNVLYCYQNGTRYTGPGVSGVTGVNSDGRLAIGAYSDFDTVPGKWKGHIDQVRITKGVARYTGATISVPTEPFPHS